MFGWGMGWFGGGANKKDITKDAILGLREQLEMLSKREKHLRNQIDDQESLARKYANNNKTAAMAALRRKRQFMHTLDQTNAQIMTLEREIFSIESANINKETLLAMKQATQAMEQIHGNLNPDKVDKIMDKLRDQHAIGEEIGEAITQGSGNQIADDVELEEELDQLQQEELDNKMLKTGPVPVLSDVQQLPEVTQSRRKSKESSRQQELDEEEELRKLQAEMVM